MLQGLDPSRKRLDDVSTTPSELTPIMTSGHPSLGTGGTVSLRYCTFFLPQLSLFVRYLRGGHKRSASCYSERGLELTGTGLLRGFGLRAFLLWVI